jgi:hypothetical protein
MNSIRPLNLSPLPSEPSQKANQTVKAEGISFDAGAINNAQTLMQAPDNLKDLLIRRLIEAPASLSFGSKEGEVAADIINHLLPSFFSDPNKFASDLLNNINKKEAPQFLDLGGDSAKFPKESWKALLEDKSALKNVFTALDQALTTTDGATSKVSLLKPLIDKIGDDKSSAPTPAVASKATNPKKLLTLGNAVKLGLIGLAAGTVTELTGLTDFSSLGPNKGVTPPPRQVITNHVMQEISSFPGKDLSKETQDAIQAKIDANLNLLPNKSIRVGAYYGDTLKPVTINGQVKAVQVQADVKTQANESGDGRPSVIIFQEENLATRTIIAPIEKARGNPLKQSGDGVTVINIDAGNAPQVKTVQSNLGPLF